MVNIDKEKCTGCGNCRRVCAGLVLRMEDGFPVYGGRGCIGCGHCQCACPTGAITVQADYAAPQPASQLEELIMSRRSIRHFKPDTPDKSLIEDVLNKAQWAPSSKNQRSNGWSVVLGKDKTDALLSAGMEWCRANGKSRGMVRLYDCGVNLITCGAPCLIFAWIDEGAINHELDCAIAMTTAEMMLHEHGLGTCWGGFSTRMVALDESLRILAGIPQNARVCCCLMVGFPDEEYTALPERPEAKIIWRD